MLEQHAQWIKDPKAGRQANLRGADLEDEDLGGADMKGVRQ